ncbi:hypothetical protein EYC80_008850 [Monilinia laxa]|uniref:Uncharacterized protein n=1 Tax=Monilinia laxa TaxID=61186 RepID=A0A5N6K1P6_MONLA|nr:hypothetical protein EYC80_008850 [Monilinia laxa]
MIFSQELSKFRISKSFKKFVFVSYYFSLVDLSICLTKIARSLIVKLGCPCHYLCYLIINHFLDACVD